VTSRTVRSSRCPPSRSDTYSARSDTYSARSDTYSARSGLVFGTSGEAAAPEALQQIIVTDIPLHPGRSGPYGRRMTICMVLVHRVRQQRPVRWTIAAAAVAPEVMGLAPTL
jgi:hypothetical protein